MNGLDTGGRPPPPGRRELPGWRDWREAYVDARHRLGSWREARWLIEEAAGERWPSVAERPVGAAAAARLQGLLARREAGEPLQYVIGHWPFRTVDVRVDRRVLIPRPETEQVVEVALEALACSGRRQPVVVDLGTGSGAVALAVSRERPDASVWAVDRSAEALEVAAANVAGTGVRLVRGDWWSALPFRLRGGVHLAIANPPYLSVGDMGNLEPAVACWEPAVALVAGPRGSEAIEAVIDGASGWLAPGGVLAVELAPDQAGGARRRAQEAGLVDVEIHPDLAGRDRALVARR